MDVTGAIFGLTVVTLLTLQGPAGVSSGTCTVCPDEWTRYEGSCYLFADSHNYNWKTATHYCALHKSHLASVESQRENNFITRHAQRLFRNSHDRSHVNFWLGGSDAANETNWVWYNTNQPMTFTHWYHGLSPDSNHGNINDCLQLTGPHGFSSWSAVACSGSAFPICEMESPLTVGGQPGEIIG